MPDSTSVLGSAAARYLPLVAVLAKAPTTCCKLLVGTMHTSGLRMGRGDYDLASMQLENR